MRIFLLTAVAMLAFAANSVLARLALVDNGIDAAGYTGVRLISAAIVLAAILYLRNPGPSRMRFRLEGSWRGAAALFGYAIAFSLAYLMLGTATGALILFASVQCGMLGWAVLKGDRPDVLEWAGMALAFASLVFLVSPGLVAPDPIGASLMALAGLSWAAYSLMGRGSRSPLSDTGGNFIRCLPIGLLLAVAGVWLQTPSLAGIAYAAASGALASGLGYSVWYTALPELSRTRASLVQLTVPAIAAVGGVLLLAEPLTSRLIISSAGIMGGVAIAVLAAERRRAIAP